MFSFACEAATRASARARARPRSGLLTPFNDAQHHKIKCSQTELIKAQRKACELQEQLAKLPIQRSQGSTEVCWTLNLCTSAGRLSEDWNSSF